MHAHAIPVEAPRQDDAPLFAFFHAFLLSRAPREGKTFLSPHLFEMNKFLLLLQTAGRSADEELGVLPPALGPARLGSARPGLAAAARTLNCRSYIVILEQTVRQAESRRGGGGGGGRRGKNFKLFRGANQGEVK